MTSRQGLSGRVAMAAGVAAVLGLWALSAAQAVGAEAAPARPRAPPPPSVYGDYHPSFSDMMTMAVQPRHTKLGLALRARNWTYATYEVGELRGAFNRITRSIPTYEGMDTAELVKMIAPPIEALQAAIRAQDAGKADEAYAEVTRTCNMCHEAQGRAYIVLRSPTASMFPDQDFSTHR